MKKLFTILMAISFSAGVFSQKQVEITGFGGYVLNGKIKTYYGDYPVDDNANYGGILSVQGFHDTFFEFMYNRNDTKFSYARNGIIGTTPTEMAVEYYQVGPLHQLDVHEKVKPFGIVTLGAVRFHPKEPMDLDGDGSFVTISDAWRFGATIGAGVKLFLSDRIGIRLQARLLMPMEFNGLFVGIGSGGASGGASFRIPLIAGDFTGGLILRLGN